MALSSSNHRKIPDLFDHFPSEILLFFLSRISVCSQKSGTKMMHMTFYWGKKVTLLVDSWKTHSWTSYALTLFICFLFSIFYQYMEERRLRFKIISKSSKPSSSSINSPLLTSSRFNLGKNSARVSVSILFGVNSAIGYLLMLAIMSFNGGVFVAIVFGLTVGYFVFRSGSDDDEVMALDNPCVCS